MSSNDNQLFRYFPLAVGNNLVKDYQAKLGGIFCASASGATIVVYEGTSASGAVAIPSFAPVAGVNYSFPINMPLGCFVVVTGTFTGTAFIQ